MFPHAYHPLSRKSDKPYRSETSCLVNLGGLCIGTLFLAFIKSFNIPLTTTDCFVFFALIVTVSIVLLEMLFFPHTAFIKSLKIRNKLSPKRVLIKLFALYFIFGVILYGYWLIYFYKYDLFIPYFNFLYLIAPYLLILSIPYFCLMDKLEESPRDSYYQLGLSILTLKKHISKSDLGELARSWLVKMFFLAIMQPYMTYKIDFFLEYDFSSLTTLNPENLFHFFNNACFYIDLAFASIGYIMTFKIINTQIRSTDNTFTGWFSALMCYWPFWDLFFTIYIFKNLYLNSWTNTVMAGSTLYYLIGVLILVFEGIYALSTIAAGIRFSNLTYRGLWSSGPYALTKHPAYVFKNLSWWLMFLPFMYIDTGLAVKGTLLLLLLNGVYYWRAKTEERHLSHYPEYVAYALHMNEKSIFRWLTPILPFLKYKAP